jgi:serine protease
MLFERYARITLICLLILSLSVAGCSSGGGNSGSEGNPISNSGDNGGDGTSPSGSAPEAVFTVSTDLGSYPLAVVFDASGTSDDDGGILRYVWDFGDGATGTGVNTSHTYGDEGIYTARVTVTDESDLTGSASHVIEVKPQYTISGAITPADNMISDSDVNDPNKGYVSNDSFEQAQEVFAPCVISGYVNMSGQGPEGRSNDEDDDPDDPEDFFIVSLAEGMSLTLYIAEYSADDPDATNLDLYLYDSGRSFYRSSIGDGAVESLSVSDEGTYYVRVQSGSDTTASTYTLTIGLADASASQATLCTGDDFVPGEVLVRFDADAEDVITELAGVQGGGAPMGFTTRNNGRGRDRLLSFSGSVEKEAFFDRLGVRSGLNRSLAHGRIDDGDRAKLETLWMVRGLRKQPGVLFAEPNYIRKPLAEPNDTLYDYQWHYPLINLPDAWDITRGSSDVVVAVIDTGVLLDHPDLQGQLVAGYDFIRSTQISADGDGRDDDPDDPGDSEGIGGSSFHGTHVAGTIAALTNNSGGVAGVAWDAKVMPLRVMGVGGGYDSDIAAAIRYAAGLDVGGVTPLEEPVDVINLSLGSDSDSQVLESACEEARAQGVIVVAAAGNDNSSRSTYPAAFDGVVSVSAVAIDESLASYSNYGDTIDVAAPGGDSGDEDGNGYSDMVLSTWGDDSGGSIDMVYGFSMGTSMAAPHVAGVAALMKSLYPGLTPNEFDALLQGGYLTRDIGDGGRDDHFGWGLIDAYKAVSVVRDGDIDEVQSAILSVSPSVLNFGTLLSSIGVTAENIGGGSLALADGSPTWNAAWLNVTASDDVGTDGLGTYVVAVDRDGQPEGTYYDTITFTASEGAEKEVAVAMRVASEEEGRDTGYYYILLMDPETYETIGQVETDGSDDGYEYSFQGLSHGDSYVIFAGTDPDNDYIICGNGEACGAYLSMDSPVELTVESDLSGIDFTTDALFNLSSVAGFQGAGSGLPLRRDTSREDGE